MTSAPVWVSPSVIEAIHDEQIATHGGASGVRDSGLLQSALARPENLAAYANPNTFDLAAAYAFGSAKNHPFIDGDKRTGFLAAYLFLRLNGHRLVAAQSDATAATLALASGELSEAEYARWFESNVSAT